MTFSHGFDPLFQSSKNLVNKQLYAIDLNNKDSEKSILDFLNDNYKEETNNFRGLLDNRSTNLLFYMGLVQKLRSINPDAASFLGYKPSDHSGRKSFSRMKVNHLHDIIENLVSRFSSRPLSYHLTPKNSIASNLHRKTKINKKLIETCQKERGFELLLARWVRMAFIMGDSYVRVFWNPNLGDFDESAEDAKGAPLLDQFGKPVKDSSGNKVEIDPHMRMGDIDFELLDARQIITQPADTFEKSEWVIHVDLVPEERLRFRYPDLADQIKPTEDAQIFDMKVLKEKPLVDHVRVYTLYHRAVNEMPEGRLIVATPDVVLENRNLPHPEIKNRQLFPIVQLTDKDVFGSSRGYAGTVMEAGKELQVAINNLYTIALRNIAKFPPLRLWPQGSYDQKDVRAGAPMDVKYDERRGTPKFLSVEPVSQSTMLMIDQLTKRLMQITNVLPISRGETIPNTESRLMLDFFKQEETNQSLPMAKKVNKALVQVGELILAIAKDQYTEEGRFIKTFGPRARFELEGITQEDLAVPLDVHIDTSNPFPDSQEGKLSIISQILTLFPGMISQQEAIDVLEMGEPEKLYDMTTASIDLANAEIESILDGKEVKSPQPYLDVVNYYSTYIKSIQQQTIRELLPDVHTPGGDDPGDKILDQILAIESILWEKKKDNPALAENLMLNFPGFPAVFEPEPVEPLNPFEIQSEALPMMPDETLQQPAPQANQPQVVNQPNQTPNQ